jgi:hypothetical protein
MFDIFYSGKKPGLFAHECEADSIEHAQQLSRTRFFWFVNYLSDYTGFDFLWEPVPWQAQQRHAWLDQYQFDSGVYLVPKKGYAETNYHAEPRVHRLPDIDYWHIPKWIDPASIDFRWAPDPTDPPYIYEFPVEWDWDRVGGPEYRIPGATDRKYIDTFVTRTQSDRDMWKVYDNVSSTDTVFNWHPNPFDPPMIYVFGNQHWPAEIRASVEYHVPGATVKKYMDDIRTTRLSDKNKFTCLYPCEFDWSWEPNPGDPPYIYVFGNQWWPAEKMATVEYHVPDAIERKFMDQPATLLSNKNNWSVPDNVDPLSIDYSWVPDPGDPPYTYVFGNQHWPGEIMPTVEYHVPGATECKYIDYIRITLTECMDNWEILEEIAHDEWDWSWIPNPLDPPYIYVFGNQWNPPEFKASVKYVVPGASEVKYMDRRTRRLPTPKLFRHNLAVSKFDYSWEPNPFDPPMMYVFGNQWNSAVLEPTVVYNAGGNEIKYVDDIIATVAQDVSAWELLDDIESFDYSWRPNPTDPPYIYVFGNQWLTPEQRPALRYCIPDATDIKYMDHPRAQRRGDHTRFVQHYPASFNWSWEPEPGSPPYNYVFGNQYYSAEVMPTIEYRMSGATERKYMDIPAQLLPHHSNHWHTLVDCEWDYTWRPEPGSPPYIYVFGNQWWSAEKMPTLEYHMVGATERKYMEGPLATLPIDMSNWSIPKHIDLTDMDFSWCPDPGEPPYIYQFATQHQKTGGPQYRMPGATEFKYVDMMRAEVKKEAAPIFEIDHLDGAAGQIPDVVKRVRYFDNYRDTLIRLAKSLVGEYEHVWVCSSICDYTDFDFSWHPETWQSTMLHVFPSDKEKFGDTFYMHVPTFAERAEKKALLEWYSVNYVPRRSVPRRPMPVILHTADSHVDAVKNTTWAGPLATFTTTDYVPGNMITVPLWRKETKTIVPLSAGASSVIVPRVAVGDVRTQLYDYAYIDKTRRMLKDHPLDIVFISNGEPYAEFNYEHLKWAVQMEGLDCNHIHHSKGVNGRVAAYQAAARLSTTPWFFAVFAKLEVDHRFDWYWQPDRMQQPKHYIFHAHNPVNGLVYGHQAMIAYNKKMTLENTGEGLDFTMDQPHEVVPIISGTANYTESPWMAWRTAFREVLKLKHSLPDVENEYRLNMWLSDAGEVKNAEWSRYGAEDAVEYYDEVGGDFAALKKSYEWDWLATYAFMKRSLTPDR